MAGTTEVARTAPPARRDRLDRLRFAARAATGLVLGTMLLAGSLPTTGPGDRAGFAALAENNRTDDLRDLAEPEVCDDGKPPEASWRPADDDGPAVRRIKERGHLVVGVDQNSYLWGFRSPGTSDIVGFDIDLVEAIASELLGERPDVVYRAVPTDQRIPLLQDGALDMVVRTMSITCDRWQEVAFSTAYFVAGQQIIAPRGSDIEGFDETLDGARVCVASGSTAQDLLEDEDHGSTLVTADHQLDCLVRVQLGEADAVMTDNALAAGQAAQDPAMRLVGDPVTVEPYGVAMNLEDKDLVRRVNQVLEDYRDGGAGSAWRRAHDRWLVEHMTEDSSPAPPAPRYRD